MEISNRVVQQLVESYPLRESVKRTAIASLGLPSGSCGLDAGCGVGLQSEPLAQSLGPAGRVIGLDVSRDLLRNAEQRIERLGLSKRVSFREGDVRALPFDDDTFDWVWSTDCVGYPAGNWEPALRELVRVTKPGGRIVILAWSSQQLLPGYPLLEARLNAMGSAYAPYFESKRPESFFMRGLGRLRDGRLEHVGVQTFVGDVQALLSNDVRQAMLLLFEMLWQKSPDILQPDWQAYERLCRPDSPDFILNNSDYYAFFTDTMFQGQKPARA